MIRWLISLQIVFAVVALTATLADQGSLPSYLQPPTLVIGLCAVLSAGSVILLPLLHIGLSCIHVRDSGGADRFAPGCRDAPSPSRLLTGTRWLQATSLRAFVANRATGLEGCVHSRPAA